MWGCPRVPTPSSILLSQLPSTEHLPCTWHWARITAINHTQALPGPAHTPPPLTFQMSCLVLLLGCFPPRPPHHTASLVTWEQKRKFGPHELVRTGGVSAGSGPAPALPRGSQLYYHCCLQPSLTHTAGAHQVDRRAAAGACRATFHSLTFHNTGEGG